MPVEERVATDMADDADAASAAGSASGTIGAEETSRKKRQKKSLPGSETEVFAASMAAAKSALASCMDFTENSEAAISSAKKKQLQAKKDVTKATNDIKLYKRKCARLQQKAKGLSEEGLLLEFSRRQAKKAAKETRDDDKAAK